MRPCGFWPKYGYVLGVGQMKVRAVPVFKLSEIDREVPREYVRQGELAVGYTL